MASTALGSCLSTTVTTHLCSKLVSSDPVLRLACHRPLRVLSIAHVRESLHAPINSQSRRFPRTLAAIAQDEAAAAVEEETLTDQGGELVTAEEEEEEEEVEVAALADSPQTKLYFGNLPYNCDSAQLAGIIQDYASPELVEVLYDRDTGRSRGFAFVTMSTVEDCEQVINNLDGSQFNGRTLRVNFSDKPRSREPLYPESEFKLFVGNLSWSVTSESLSMAFQEHGNVVGARVLYDGDTGRSRGYGFVSYSTKEEMDNAMEALNGVELEGRSMRISLAVGTKSPR